MNTSFLRGWRPAVVIILLFIIWEISTRIADIPAWLLPSPSRIANETFAVWPTFQEHLSSTVFLTLLGFLIGCGIGLVVAVGLHLVPALRESVYPLLILSQNIPIIVLAPLLVVWFGFGLMPKMIVITLVCFFPVSVAALDGFRQTGQELKHYMQMAGASKMQIFRKLEWPHALPSIFSGLKISATYSVMGAVISEWLGAKQGIGVFMTLASSSFRTDRVFVAIFAIMLLSLVFFAVIIGLEKWLIKWRPKGEEKRGKVENR
jgi:ABC-type nitrate/sulfonate/bicarbonate transport system permease component